MKSRCAHRFANSGRVMIMLGILLMAPQQLKAIGLGTNLVSRYSVRTWQTDEGLPQNSVHAIAQTLEGYLWIGTREGLARFDGARFVRLEDSAPAELRQGWITALCATRDGVLWIACEGHGLTRMAAGTFQRFTESEGLPSNQIRCLFEGPDGTLWIGSEGGLVRLAQGRFSRFTTGDGLTDNSVRSISEDRNGTILIATLGGWSRLDTNGVVQTHPISVAPAIGALRAIHADPHGGVWLGALDGLTWVTSGRRTRYGVRQGLPDNVISALYTDRDGQLWVGTYGGLVRIVQGQVYAQPLQQLVFNDLINVLFEDRELNLWVGGRDGLYRLNPARVTNYMMEHGLPYNNVMSVLEDRAGDLWLGTWGGGVSRLRVEAVTVINNTNGLTHNSVLSLHEGRDGRLWVGMDFGGGLNRLGPDLRNDFARDRDLIRAAIRVIHEDRTGALWVGTSRGLNILRGDRTETYTTAEGLAGNTVMVLRETEAGGMWVGTEAGLSYWEAGRFRNYTRRDGLSDAAVNALYLDPDGTLWIGTREGGLNRLRAARFTSYTTGQGLFSDEIYEILEDDSGHLWMSCRRGIFRVSKNEIEAFDRGEARSLNSTVFGRADGLATVQCNGVSKPAGWKSRDGRLWFPTIRGVVAIEPGVHINEQVPPILIEEIWVEGRRVFLGQATQAPAIPLKVPPGSGELEIRYTGLSFQAPEKMRFKYRLEGWDAHWIEAGDQRMARYAGVQPGQYRFQVLGCNNDGVWNQTGAMLSVVIQPHYWQTWWFRLLLASAAVLLITFVYRRRLARLREIEQLRVRIAADLHDDVGARLTKVAMLTETLERETPATNRTRAQVENIARTTHEIIRAMDETVWTINPQNDTLDNLANYIFHFAQEYFQHTGVRCRFDLPVGLPNKPISTEARHHLFMAVKEVLNNILKHSAATEVRIGLAAHERTMTLSIADNGRGFDPASVDRAGEGLRNLRERLHQLGGRLDLRSQPGAGTSVTLEIRTR